MKSLKFYLVLGLSALFVLSACNKDEPTDDSTSGSGDTPVLTLSETTLTVSAEGGTVSVDYQVENPVDGASVSVDLGTVTWLTVDVTDSTIDLTVEANSSTSSRTATLTVSYSGAEDVSLTVVQEAVEGSEDTETPVLTLSETNLTIAGEGGQVSVDYQVENPVDGETVSVDLGDATWLTVDVTESTIDLTVEANSSTSSRTATLTVSYPGAEDVSLTVVQEAYVEFTATVATASHYDNDRAVMEVTIVLTNIEGYDGSVTSSGILLSLDTYMPYDANGTIAEGTYTVGRGEESMTIYPDYYSRIYDYETTSNYTADNIASGTMVVNSSGIECNFVTDGGTTVKCTYSRTLVVADVPSRTSTLTGDITDLDFTGATVTLTSYGNMYGTGTNLDMSVTLLTSGAGPALALDLNAESGSTFPWGTYSASTTTSPAVGEFLYGYGSSSGSWYREYEDYSGRIASNKAPLVGGSITFTDNGDDTYTATFNFTDDAGYTISGSWTASIP